MYYFLFISNIFLHDFFVNTEKNIFIIHGVFQPILRNFQTCEVSILH